MPKNNWHHKEMKRLILFALFLFPLLSNAQQSRKGLIEVEPIVGYERIMKLEPTVHTKDRLTYGLRASFGVPSLSAEAELTQAKDTESFADRDLTIKETSTTAMLGLRSSLRLGKILSFFLRAGAHARKSEIERTEASVTTTKNPAIYVSPYAGAGLGINLNNRVRANAGLTVIFTGRPRGSDREYRPTLGLSMRF